MKHLGPLIRKGPASVGRVWSRDGARISYDGGGSVSVVEVPTHDRTRVAKGVVPEWSDNDTLVMSR